MKKFKINYLVRYFEGASVDFTHSHRWLIFRVPTLTETKEHAFSFVMSSIGDSEGSIKSVEIGEIEEVKDESH
jgi:hypothetical protein